MQNLKLFLIAILISQTWISCKNVGERVSDEEQTKADAVQECYLYVENSDTIKMEITIQDTKITGNLVYNLYEKDKNVGTIRGEMQGERLNAIYTFKSEGVESTRELTFKKNGDAFVEGYYLDGNHTIVDFPGKVVLLKVACK